MSEPKEKRSDNRVEKKHKKHKSEKHVNKIKAGKKISAAEAFSLLADEKAVDPTLSSLFAAKPVPPKPLAKSLTQDTARPIKPRTHDVASVPDLLATEVHTKLAATAQSDSGEDEHVQAVEQSSKRSRKRKHDEGELEDAYMHRLAREETKDAEFAAAGRATKRQRRLEGVGDPNLTGEANGHVADDEIVTENHDAADIPNGDDDEGLSPPPKHETEQAVDDELLKANRTVFLGNVSTAAISSKSARRTLIEHLKSFFNSLSKPKDGEPKHAIESIRFRSTPYAAAIPKKAAFATKQLMDATTKTTNAYAVYSSQALAREAAKHLNGTVVLSRHLRVDEVAHPSIVDHRRCIFVGNLGFVDDESNIQAANEEEGKEKRKPSKYPADAEEGLWRTFGKCGTVESVRVIRDSTTRVGKGIAYVQFEDANAVEAALLYDGKKFPPMLPRKLRVSRAKAQKRNAKPGSGRPSSKPASRTGYQRKISGEEASKLGRTGKLFGRAAAAQVKRSSTGGNELGAGIRRPESFVFEGHRASSKGGKSGLKLGGKGKKAGGRPTGRSAAFKKKTKAKTK